MTTLQTIQEATPLPFDIVLAEFEEEAGPAPCRKCNVKGNLCPYLWARDMIGRVCPELRGYYQNNGGGK